MPLTTARCRMCGIVFQAEEDHARCHACWTAEHLGEGIGDTRVPTLDADDGLARIGRSLPFEPEMRVRLPARKRQAPPQHLSYRFPVEKPKPPPVKNLWQRLSDALEDDPS